MPPTPDLSFTNLKEFTNEHVVENSEALASEAMPKAVRKNNGAPIIKDSVSGSEEENVSQTKIEKKTAKPMILNGDGPIQVTTNENGVETKVPPKTAQALLQRQRERKAKSILLLAIPDEYQLRFHGIKDAKSLWAAIKSRFGGNVESKKMQKNVLKQQFENFSVSDTKGLNKSYDRFQKLISLLEVHGAAVPNEDANQKCLRGLPSS
ncbi:hypothetical protein Tco_0472370 [Tanacetum coccineum]